MKISPKILIFTLISILLLQTIPSFAENQAIVFKDIKSSDYYYKSINTLVNKKIINGYSNETFKPNNSVKVNEFIKMIVTCLGFKNLNNSSKKWDKEYIDKALNIGIIEKNEFNKYNRNINRGEAAKIIIKGLNYLKETNYPNDINLYKSQLIDFETIPKSIQSYVLKAFRKGIITGYPSKEYKPLNEIKRGEACVLISRMIDKTQRKVPILTPNFVINNSKETQQSGFWFTINFNSNLPCEILEKEDWEYKRPECINYPMLNYEEIISPYGSVHYALQTKWGWEFFSANEVKNMVSHKNSLISLHKKRYGTPQFRKKVKLKSGDKLTYVAKFRKKLSNGKYKIINQTFNIILKSYD